MNNNTFGRRNEMTKNTSYDVKVTTPVGIQNGTLYFEVNDNVLTGKLVNDKGEFEIKEGTIEDGVASFKAKLVTPLGRMKVTITGKIEGETFKGNAKMPLGSASIEGTLRK
jgi:phage antirepressor YoqD-like protein